MYHPSIHTNRSYFSSLQEDCVQTHTVVKMNSSMTNSADVYSSSQSPFYLSGDHDSAHIAHVGGELHQNGFHHVEDAAPYFSNISSVYNSIKASNPSLLCTNLDFNGVTNSLSSAEIGTSNGGQFGFDGGSGGAAASGLFQDWGDSGVVPPQSLHTDSDDKNQFPGISHENLIALESNKQSNAIIGDPKKLAKNREAARKSRLKKKTYVQQLESSKQRLIEVEQNLKRARQQGNLVRSRASLGCVAFDVEYKGWADEHQRLINDLRWALNCGLSDTGLHLVVEQVMSNYHKLFRMKRSGAKSDIFYILSGSWKTPAERFFMWLGGFRSSDLLKVLGRQIEALTEQQMGGMCDLQKSCLQTEDALSQGMEALQQAIVDTLSHNCLASGNVVDYMGQMAVAMTKIATFDNFLHQADLLRLQTLQQLQRILTVRQTARALLAINAYDSRLRALTSLWLK